MFFFVETLDILIFPLFLYPMGIEFSPRSKTEAITFNIKILQGNDSAMYLSDTVRM